MVDYETVEARLTLLLLYKDVKINKSLHFLKSFFDFTMCSKAKPKRDVVNC